ncbi:hypothetical protein D3C80_1843430 [compost metagenome]
MQQHRRTQDAPVAAFLHTDLTGVFPYTVQVGNVVGSIVGIEGQRQQRLRQFLMG